MDRMVLVKLGAPAEKRVCMEIASAKSVASCHPMLGDWDLVVALEGTEDELASAIRRLRADPAVERIEVNERPDFQFIKMKGLPDRGPDYKRTPDGMPYVICPRCGNETFAYSKDCPSIPSPKCLDAHATDYTCAVCGNRMLVRH